MKPFFCILRNKNNILANKINCPRECIYTILKPISAYVRERIHTYVFQVCSARVTLADDGLYSSKQQISRGVNVTRLATQSLFPRKMFKYHTICNSTNLY